MNLATPQRIPRPPVLVFGQMCTFRPQDTGPCFCILGWLAHLAGVPPEDMAYIICYTLNSLSLENRLKVHKKFPSLPWFEDFFDQDQIVKISGANDSLFYKDRRYPDRFTAVSAALKDFGIEFDDQLSTV